MSEAPTFSILVPTRGRRNDLLRLIDSLDTTMEEARDYEIVVYIDHDDPSYDGLERPCLRVIRGPRIVLSKMWNACYAISQGEILMHCGDDIVFRTQGWDRKVREAFEQYEDRIVLVHGDDLLHPNGRLATHSFLHRRWVETVGHFVPPYFVSDFNDVWLTDVANELGRKVYLPDVVTEHMHYCAGKGPKDQTHIDRLERHSQERPDLLYKEKKPEREEDVRRLREVIEACKV
jgi:glycosyltransferase involved in cell wall biosynthesis